MGNWVYDNKKRYWIFKEDNIILSAKNGINTGEFFTDENGNIRRRNSDGTNTKVQVKNGKYYWTQPDGKTVYNTRLTTLDGHSYFDITDKGIDMIIESEGMGAPNYSGRWYKRKEKESSDEWDGWFIGNGLSETFNPILNEKYGDPDSDNFTITEFTANKEQYKVAIPKDSTPVLDKESLRNIMKNNRNDVFEIMRSANPELYRLITYAPTPVQEALYSLYHQYGADYTNPNNKGLFNSSGKERYHYDTDRIINALKNKDYKQVAELIRNYDKTYKKRRNREADYIINNLNLKK